MLLQIVVRTICETIEFILAERKIELEIDSSLGIECPLAIRNFEFMNLGHIQANIFHESFHLNNKMLKCFFPFFRIDEIFYFHLLEFARSEKEIARRDLIPESFTNLRHAERKLRMCRVHNVLEIYEHTLSGLRSEI